MWISCEFPYGKITGKTHMCTLYTNPSEVSQYAGYAHFYQQCDFLSLVLLMGVTAWTMQHHSSLHLYLIWPVKAAHKSALHCEIVYTQWKHGCLCYIAKTQSFLWNHQFLHGLQTSTLRNGYEVEKAVRYWFMIYLSIPRHHPPSQTLLATKNYLGTPQRYVS